MFQEGLPTGCLLEAGVGARKGHLPSELGAPIWKLGSQGTMSASAGLKEGVRSGSPMFVLWGGVSSEGRAQVSIAMSLWARPKSVCPSGCVVQRRRTRQEPVAGAARLHTLNTL